MPPWAAFECERTGWTLETIPTETPSSAAASAARCPARPAPMTRTSCVGIRVRFYVAGAVARRARGLLQLAGPELDRDHDVLLAEPRPARLPARPGAVADLLDAKPG